MPKASHTQFVTFEPHPAVSTHRFYFSFFTHIPSSKYSLALLFTQREKAPFLGSTFQKDM